MKEFDIIWRPRPDDLENSNAARLMKRHGMKSAEGLRSRAASDPEWFYPAVLEDLGVEWFDEYEELMDASRGLPWTDWFVGGRLNLVHNVLDRHVRDGFGAQAAVIAENDREEVETLTYEELNQRVCRLAAVLHGMGAGVDDCVGFYLPMTADVVVALLACLKIGAVPVPVFAGFGPDALAARLRDCGARILLTADATVRRGRKVLLKAAVDRALELETTVQAVLVLRRTGDEISWKEGRDHGWREAEDAAPAEWPTEALDSAARSMVLYTSGTTGRPKGVVHSHAGVQVVTAKEVGYHLDVRPGDVMFWLTDIGWMMGPWEILGVLFHRGTVVLLDGAPDFPSPDRVWSMVERHRITHLALAPTAVRVLMTHGSEPPGRHDLSSIRILGSTGEPWDASSYEWYFRNAGGGRCPVINISGGTELMGCLLAPLPVAPIKPTSLQGGSLGMDVDVFDEEGRSVREQVGYLVCRGAAPNMTRGFLTGRADDTLKVAGKRIGPGEVEAAAVSHEAVREAAAVGLPDPVKGTRLVLVAVAAPDHQPSPELSEAIRKHVSDHMGPTMRPAGVIWVDALPVTRSGKILRGTIKKVLSGEDPGSLASAANPEAVEAISRKSGATSNSQ